MTACPACGSPDTRVFHRQRQVPVNSCLLVEDAETAAAFPRGDIDLSFCEACGFLFNALFDPVRSVYDARYEETQGYSARFRDFAADLARDWVGRYDLTGKRVLEIGCGKGEFLQQMVVAGAGPSVGVDPSAHVGRLTGPGADEVTLVPKPYDASWGDIDADAVVCRHTLEHIAPVRDFLDTVRAGIGDRTDTIVLFELPDVLRVLHEVAFWDVYYEHCSYFTQGSLARLFERCGFEVLDVRLEFDDQYILLEARPVAGAVAPSALPQVDDLAEVAAAVADFGRAFDVVVDTRRKELLSAAEAGQRTVIWGAGSKGVSYLTTLDIADAVSYAVDINPRKHDFYLAGSGQRVVGPEFLRDYRPDVVIAMNAIYTDEIGADLARLDLQPTLLAV